MKNSEILLSRIKESYDFGQTYFAGEINGEEFKIRMNKDHARNGGRNDDYSVHNLSLIDNVCSEGIGSKLNNSNKYQMQVDCIYSWEDAEIQIEEFFYQISNI